MIQRFTARECRLYEFGQIRLYLILSDVLVQTPWAKAILPAVRRLFLEGNKLLILIHIQCHVPPFFRIAAALPTHNE